MLWHSGTISTLEAQHDFIRAGEHLMRNSFTGYKCPNDTGIIHRPKAILCSAWLFVE